MEDLPLPIEISKQVWMVPCKISNDIQCFKPLIWPLGKQEIPIIKKTKWKSEEEALLGSLASKTKRWSAIAKEINITFHSSINIRDGKQCRERWNNHINPLLNKEKWSNEEDCIIIEHLKIFGKKWAKIAALLKNRTENQVKNRWKSLESKSINPHFYPYPGCNLKGLGNIEPIGNELDNLSPIGSFKADDIMILSPIASISSTIEKYYGAANLEQIRNSQLMLDDFISKMQTNPN